MTFFYSEARYGVLTTLEFASTAYCMVNHKEFFAEMSVTYLANGYHDLDEGDCSHIELCSPPLMAPVVIQRVQKKRKRTAPYGPRVLISHSCDAKKESSPALNPINGFLQLFTRRDSDVARTKVPHCNKFYPFTRGQFQFHDPELCDVFAELWKEIEDWNDEDDEMPCMRLRKCWSL